ncbi:copper uptake system-associated protein [Ideonella sp.]|uniref:copper uptake system-associated protein n=1 Tax=Ideonella sp. TaxID=1929293 RepID=UPI003BB73F66
MTSIASLLRHSLAALFILIGLPAWAADATADQAAIREVLMRTFDKPEARLRVAPVVVEGDHSVAGWVQGERGGRALLRRHGGKWQVTLCAGDGLKDAKVLHEAGITPAAASALAKGLAAAESKLPAAQRAKFSTFDGVVRMDAGGHHPPVHH